MPDPSLLQIAMLAGLQMADFATTQGIMANGGMELNPIMQNVAQNPVALGVTKVAPIIGAMMLRKNANEEERKKLAKALKIMNLFMSGIVANNIYQLSKK